MRLWKLLLSYSYPSFQSAKIAPLRPKSIICEHMDSTILLRIKKGGRREMIICCFGYSVSISLAQRIIMHHTYHIASQLTREWFSIYVCMRYGHRYPLHLKQMHIGNKIVPRYPINMIFHIEYRKNFRWQECTASYHITLFYLEQDASSIAIALTTLTSTRLQAKLTFNLVDIYSYIIFLSVHNYTRYLKTSGNCSKPELNSHLGNLYE